MLTTDEARFLAGVLAHDEVMADAVETLGLLAIFLGRMRGLYRSLAREDHHLAAPLAEWLKELEPLAAGLEGLPARRKGSAPSIS